LEVISAWIRSIVFILILASILEMLIPRGGIQRFVQVVLGLLIIMLLIQPVLGLLSRQAFFDRRLAALSSDLGQTADAASIIARGEELSKRNQLLTAAEFERRVAALSEEYALTVDGISEAKAEVETSLTDSGGQPRAEVRELRLTVRAGRSPAGDDTIAPVKTVTIGSAPAGEDTSTALPDAVVSEAEKERIRTELLRTFNNFYGLSPEKISVEFN